MKFQVVCISNIKQHGAACQILIIENKVFIMLDCGLNLNLDFTQYQKNQEIISKVDIILLSHAGQEFCGALPFMLDKFKISPQIFCTSPITKIGLLNLYDTFLNSAISKDNSNCNFYMDVFKKLFFSFEKNQELKFLQKKSIVLKKFPYTITISPYGIGNSIGGCAWLINCNITNILYMIQYNIYAEMHLEGLDLHNLKKKRINIVITDYCYDLTNINHSSHLIMSTGNNQKYIQDRIKASLEQAMKTQSQAAFICYPNERIIEVIMILHDIWKENKNLFKDIKFNFYHIFSQYLDIIRSLIDYLSVRLSETVHSTEYNPFDPQFLNILRQTDNNSLSLHSSSKFMITTYSMLFVDTMQNYLEKLVDNENNQIILIGYTSLDCSNLDQFKLNNLLDSINKKEQLTMSFYSLLSHKIQTDENLSKKITTNYKEYEDEEEQQNLENIDMENQTIQSTVASEMTRNSYVQNFNRQSAMHLMEVEDLTQQSLIHSVNNPTDFLTEQNIIEEENLERTQEFKESDLLFAPREFPRYMFVNKKQKHTQYGQTLNDDEVALIKNLGSCQLNSIQIKNLTKVFENPEQLAEKQFNNYKELSDQLQQKPQKVLKNLPIVISQAKINQKYIQEFRLLGVSDNKSQKYILQDLNPQLVVLLGGGQQQLQQLSMSLDNKSTSIISCDNEANFDIPYSSLDIYNFKFDDDQLKKSQAVPVKGQLIITYNPEKGTTEKELELHRSEEEDDLYCFFSDYSFQTLLKYFQEKKLKFTIFNGGINYQNKVLIKKSPTKNFILEGICCPEYFLVKKYLLEFIKN